MMVNETATSPKNPTISGADTSSRQDIWAYAYRTNNQLCCNPDVLCAHGRVFSSYPIIHCIAGAVTTSPIEQPGTPMESCLTPHQRAYVFRRQFRRLSLTSDPISTGPDVERGRKKGTCSGLIQHLRADSIRVRGPPGLTNSYLFHIACVTNKLYSNVSRIQTPSASLSASQCRFASTRLRVDLF